MSFTTTNRASPGTLPASSLRLNVHVHPGSKHPGVGGTHDGDLIVRVRERAVNGAATEAVVRAVADAFDVPVRTVSVVRGLTSRKKTLEILGHVVALSARLAELQVLPG